MGLASFTNRQSQGRAAPVPLFFGVDGGSTPYMVNFFMPANHPFNPFGIDLDGSGATTGTANAPFFTKRPLEAGPRIFDQDVDTWYLSGGFDGDFEVGGRTMYWDVTGIMSENNATQTKHNQFNARLHQRRLGRSCGLRHHARLRATRYLRRREHDAGNAQLHHLHRCRYEQPGT